MSLEKLSRDDWIIGGVALLTVISLLFFPWFSFSSGSFSFTLSGTSSPDGWLGVLAVLCALGVAVDLVIERLVPEAQIPALSGSRTTTRFYLAVATAVFVALKFLFHIHFSLFGWGFYLSVVLVAGLVYLTMKARTVTAASPNVPVA